MVCNCDCSIRGHNVAFLRNDDIRSRVLVSCAHHNGVRVACDILVCVYDIPVFCCNHHDAMVVVYSDHNYDGWASLVDSELAHDEQDNVVCTFLRGEPDNEAYVLPHDAVDNEVCALPHDVLDSVACAPHDEVDKPKVYALHDEEDKQGVCALPCIPDSAMVGHIRLGSVLLTPLPIMTQK